MLLQTVLEVGLVLTATLREDGIAGDDPSFHLVQADLAAELYRFTRLEAWHYLGVRLEQRQQLFSAGTDSPLSTRRTACSILRSKRGRNTPSRWAKA